MIVESILISILVKACYDLTKTGLKSLVESDFPSVYKETIRATLEKYPSMDDIHLEILFDEESVKNEIAKIKNGKTDLDMQILNSEFNKVLDEKQLEVDGEEVLTFFFNTLQEKVERIPKIRALLELEYLKDLKENHKEMKSQHEDMAETLEVIRRRELGELASKHKDDIPQLTKDFSIISKELSKDPDYKTKVTIEDGKTELRLSRKHDQAPPIKGKVSVKSVEKDGKLVTLHDELSEAFKTRKEIEIEGDRIIDFQATLRDKPLTPKMPEEKEGMKLVIAPEPFPEPTSCVVQIPGSDEKLENMIISKIYEDEEKIKLSTEERNFPFEITIDFFRSSENVNMSFSYDFKEADIAQALKFDRFSRAMAEHLKLEIYDTDNDKLLLRGTLNSMKYDEWSDRTVKILEALLFIEEKTGAKFAVPETLSDVDARTLGEIHQIVETGEMETTVGPSTMEYKKEGLEDLISQLKDGDILEGMGITHGGCTATLLGQSFELGPVRHILPPMRMTNKDEAIRLSKESDADFITLKFEPADSKIGNSIYGKWKKTDD